jgi:hypothetical protein
MTRWSSLEPRTFLALSILPLLKMYVVERIVVAMLHIELTLVQIVPKKMQP